MKRKGKDPLVLPVGNSKPSPLLKVPGTGLARWDKYLGRWVVGPLTLEREY